MFDCKPEFYQGCKGKLFRLIRTPEIKHGHIIYVSPLFEQANQTRHMITRSALNAAKSGVESIIFDHYGSGDSEGELIDATLALWQEDILKQINEIRQCSQQPIFISAFLSAGLLLNDDILSLIDGLLLVQPELSGKSFIRQFKRMGIAGDLIKDSAQSSVEANKARNEKENDKESTEPIIDIAGYQLSNRLLSDLTMQGSGNFSNLDLKVECFEWLSSGSELGIGRKKLHQSMQAVMSNIKLFIIDDLKFWQATSLQVAETFLNEESETLALLLDDCKLSGQIQ